MNLKAVTSHRIFRPAVGAALAIACGLFLLLPRPGERWVNFSYDTLFLFGLKKAPSDVVLVLMDNDACHQLKQERTNWSRELHTEMLRLLTQGGAALVVFDVYFGDKGERPTDLDLAAAMRENGHVVIRSKLFDAEHPGVEFFGEPILPHKLFLDAAAGYGIGQCELTRSGFPRRHWPLSTDNENRASLPAVAAQVAGARSNDALEERWLRYYGERGGWEPYSYHLALALSNSPAFSNKVVFIGRSPDTDDMAHPEDDKFSMPRTAWHPIPKGVGGVKILATTFLNLMNGDWLRRAPDWVESSVLLLTGLLFGAGLSFAKPSIAWPSGIVAAILLLLGACALSYRTNYWFPWAIIAGGQIPCALAVNLVGVLSRRTATPVATSTLVLPSQPSHGDAPTPVPLPATAASELPDAPDYEIFDPPFGEGGYGKVWLVRNAIGQWQALKIVYRKKFGADSGPYDREFNGIKRYKPISQKHPGLLCVDFVSTKKEAGYFYYVMELGDGVLPGWEAAPARYIPRDLSRIRAAAPGRRLPVKECIRIGVALADALDFLHQQGLTHRDIKPQNIIFVKDRPKLADVGLVADILPDGKENTQVGTLGYMPPQPEHAGTVQADIYGLGMVLYVIRTGQEPALFPQVSTTLVASPDPETFLPLNAVILKACQPDQTQRYASATELRQALLEIQPQV